MPDPSLDRVREQLARHDAQLARHDAQRARHDEHLVPKHDRPPGEGPAGIREGGDATVAGQGEVDLDAVREARERLEQAGGGH